jgi:hypothetical protein
MQCAENAIGVYLATIAKNYHVVWRLQKYKPNQQPFLNFKKAAGAKNSLLLLKFQFFSMKSRFGILPLGGCLATTAKNYHVVEWSKKSQA